MRKFAGVLAWFFATLFVIYGFSLSTAASVFSGAIKSSLSLSDIQVSYAIGSFVIGYACMQIPAGYLLDRYKARYIVSLGILILALGNYLASTSSSLLFFSIANLIQGVGASFGFVSVGILISQWFSSKLFPVFFGLTQTLSFVASSFIHYYLLRILQSHSWNDVYFYLTFFGLGMLILSLLFIKNNPELDRGEASSLFKALKTVCS